MRKDLAEIISVRQHSDQIVQAIAIEKDDCLRQQPEDKFRESNSRMTREMKNWLAAGQEEGRF